MVGLVHTRLAILDVSDRGLQPMASRSGRFRISFNGEVYNFRTLRRYLENVGAVFQTDTDTEVILEGFEYWGTEVFAKLEGMFSIALWDSVARRMYLARDNFGVKPLYYHVGKCGVSFASEIKALWAVEDFDDTIDPIAIAQYLSFMYCLAPRTPLKAVKKVGKGELICIEDGVLHSSRKFGHTICYNETLGGSPDEWAAKILSALDAAVGRQMVSDVPVGSFLSGGLDSSAITAFARQYTASGRFCSFTAAPANVAGNCEGMISDLPYAIRVAELLDVDLKQVPISEHYGLPVEDLVWHLDEPLADPAAYNTYLIARAARDNGIKVLLSGAGGDDLFSGYRRHAAIACERTWVWMPRSIRALGEAVVRLLPKRSPMCRRVSRALQDASRGADERLVRYFSWLRPLTCLRVLSPDLRSGVDEEDIFGPMLERSHAIPPSVGGLNRMLHLDCEFFLPDHNLNYTDKMSMAAGVEVRVPFLDKGLAQLAACIPPDLKQRGLEGKWVFKEAMRSYLPEDVIFRPKSGFGVPLRTWLSDGQGRKMARYLNPGLVASRGILDSQVITSMVKDNAEGREDYAYPLYAAMCIEAWFSVYKDDKRWKSSVAN